AWATYSFTPKSNLQFNFRHQKVSQQFIPNGGSLTDFSAKANYWVRSDLEFSGLVQHERWLFPAIQPNASDNVTAAVQVTFEPRNFFARK
ncbi:MAG: capsule assembly Wzi family protein, partial [Candidatus Angelobacter sp.]